jgi:peroxiredoxin
MLDRPIPDVILKTRVRDETIGGDNPFRWQDFKVRDEFAGKTVVIFSLPGAFTPTCSNEQCPAFERLYDDLREAGADEVYCLAVNDAFVMYQWGKHLGLKNVKLLPTPARFTEIDSIWTKGWPDVRDGKKTVKDWLADFANQANTLLQ